MLQKTDANYLARSGTLIIVLVSAENRALNQLNHPKLYLCESLSFLIFTATQSPSMLS